MILMSAERAAALGCTPLARVRGFADAATLPIDFPIAPALAVPKALEWAGVSKDDVSLNSTLKNFKNFDFFRLTNGKSTKPFPL